MRPAPPLTPSPAPRRVVAGIGFRHAVEAEDIVGLIRRALATEGVPEARLAAIATAEDRASEPPALAAAAAFGMAITGIAQEAMRAAAARVETYSERIEASRGVGSVAEAAALALAGEAGRLILPRIASVNATCALALAPDFP